LSVDGGDGIEIRIQRLPHAEDLPLPRRATPHAAGFDLRARVDGGLDIKPGERALVPTGFAVALPAGFEAQIRPRSGLAMEHGLTLLNSPGTIDSDYRGEVGVVLINLGEESVRITRGDRIAQLVVQRLPRVRLAEADGLPDSDRGTGGFGHTGRR
jgi:dUTP pyrophosphatase